MKICNNILEAIGNTPMVRLNKIIANTNNKTLNFSNDIYASGIDFINSTGQSKIQIADTKTLDITGDISNISDSIIFGSHLQLLKY